jgi:hypothetical protein
MRVMRLRTEHYNLCATKRAPKTDFRKSGTARVCNAAAVQRFEPQYASCESWFFDLQHGVDSFAGMGPKFCVKGGGLMFVDEWQFA